MWRTFRDINLNTNDYTHIRTQDLIYIISRRPTRAGNECIVG